MVEAATVWFNNTSGPIEDLGRDGIDDHWGETLSYNSEGPLLASVSSGQTDGGSEDDEGIYKTLMFIVLF